MFIALALTSSAQSHSSEPKEVKTYDISTAKPFTIEEEAAARKQIEGLEIKTKANAENPNIDYPAELQRLQKMKARFNERATNKFSVED